jgi:SAM-dependent methyltransferase
VAVDGLWNVENPVEKDPCTPSIVENLARGAAWKPENAKPRALEECKAPVENPRADPPSGGEETLMPQEWYDECFDQLYLQVYGLGLERAQREVDFIVRALELPLGASVLDLACGHGRHAIELARRGFAVAGLDLSRPLLEKARELAAEAGVKAEWLQEDMRRIPETWAARFDAIINVFTSWGYFASDVENEKVLEGVARSLKLGGRFLLDYISQQRLVRDFRMHSWWETSSGALVLDRPEYDLLAGRVDTARKIVLPDGTRVERRISFRLFTLPEVRAMLERCGMKVIATYGDFEAAPYEMESRRMIVVAERGR